MIVGYPPYRASSPDKPELAPDAGGVEEEALGATDGKGKAVGMGVGSFLVLGGGGSGDIVPAGELLPPPLENLMAELHRRKKANKKTS